VSFDVTSDKATPSNQELKKKCASILGADEKLVVVKKVETFFGSTGSKATVYQYKDEEKLKSIEPREKKAEEKKEGGEAPAEEAKKEAPKAEEKPKEETPKKEEKKEGAKE
jgi:ribosomal protein S24E